MTEVEELKAELERIKTFINDKIMPRLPVQEEQKNRRWSNEEIQHLLDNKNTRFEELSKAWKNHFGWERSYNSIRGKVASLKKLNKY